MENEIIEEVTLEKFINDRITENETLFRKEELVGIKENNKLIKKIYLIGFVNSRGCQLNNLLN